MKKQNKTLGVRMSEREHVELEAKAAAAGLTVAVYVRAVFSAISLTPEGGVVGPEGREMVERTFSLEDVLHALNVSQLNYWAYYEARDVLEGKRQMSEFHNCMQAAIRAAIAHLEQAQEAGNTQIARAWPLFRNDVKRFKEGLCDQQI